MDIHPVYALARNAARSGRRVRPVKIGIRSEDPARIWERRAPLTPDAVYGLTSSGSATVDVVTSSRRVFNDDEYRKAGANVVTSLRDSTIILGIKEPPLEEVQYDSSEDYSRDEPQTHLMFSHTAKGQPYNTPLLAQFVNIVDPAQSPRPRLIDYELLTNEEDGKRTVGFGWFAGVAGVLEALSSMAHSHLEIGVASPFLYTPRPHTLPSLDKLRAALRQIGTVIANEGTPPQLGPFIFGLTGTGRVAEGCLSMLSELPIEKVQVTDLPSLMQGCRTGSNVDLNKIYLVHAKPADYFVRIDGGKYDRDHYYQSPQSYTSVFAEKVAPYLTLFLNGTGWSPSFPRLMTNDQLPVALARAKTFGGARFTNIGDISCDVQGGLEFLTQATTLTSPFYKVRPQTLPSELPSVQMMSVDILPASIPLDASNHFSSALKPYLEDLITYHTSSPRGEYPKALQKATIAADGRLTEKHEWLYPSVRQYFQTDTPEAGSTDEVPTTPKVVRSQPKKILMLGSGMVAQPAVDMIARRPDIELVIASNSLLELQALVAPHLNVKYRLIDFHDLKSYESLVQESDVVISLLPAIMHHKVAQDCINHGKHLVTASYISRDMSKLHSAAVNKGVLLLNEIGLDPGIDHCSARELISRLKKSNKEIQSFTSFCGGLPAPEDSHVPLRYKFSWRPQGVLTAALNDARYLLNAKEEYIPSRYLLTSYFPDIPITPDFELEGLPNRNSLHYIDQYKLNQEPKLSTFVRGTLRYPGFSSLMGSFSKIGLLNSVHPITNLESWETFVAQSLSLKLKTQEGVLPSLSSLVPVPYLGPLQDALEWLGLVKSPMIREAQRSPMPPLPEGPLTPLDIFAYLLSQKLKYEQHERDMVVLSHEIITKDSTRGHNKREVHTSTLITYGTKTPNVGFQGERPASAMARTVGIPVAIAALLVAEGKIKLAGVQGPLSSAIYNPVLEGLAEVGLHMVEKTNTILKGKRTVEGALLAAPDLRKGLRGPPTSLDPDAHDLDSDSNWREEEV
ncbi:Saccharopine dehydrogenase-domain-containing protein [Flammula alnicola]|nr:Saccharopine dehydrogenase-domain-containing protein [Flammula alnicola]